jgi:hypothetical protein
MKVHLKKILHMKFNPFCVFAELDFSKMTWKMEFRVFEI